MQNKLGDVWNTLWVALLVLIISVTVAEAETTDATITVPWGLWVKQVLDSVQGVVTIVAISIVGKFVPAVFRQYLTDEVLTKAVAFAIASTEGAVQGKTVDMQVIDGLLGQAEKYCLENAPRLTQALSKTLRPKLLARLSEAGVVPADYKGE